MENGKKKAAALPEQAPEEPEKEQNRKYAYWLSCAEKISSRVRRCLFPKFQNAKAVFDAREKQLKETGGLTDEDIGRILASRRTWNIDKEWRRLKESGIRFTSVEEETYPDSFRQLSDAPYGICYRGSLPPAGQFCAAVVGARMCSEYGRSIAREIARELAAHDAAVISGMARGIDAAGHRGALDSGGATYAVFGCGVDVCYPNYHRQLYYEIARQGGLISEYPPGAGPMPYRFPKRNRLISALSDVVLVIEAKQGSGSLITADCALEQGKDVYALPGRITDALSSGCNRLISQGAGIVLSVEDFLEEMFMEAQRKKNFVKTPKLPLEKDELLVYGCFGLLPAGIEEILGQTGLNVQTVTRILASLQQKHYIEEVYKNHFQTLIK